MNRPSSWAPKAAQTLARNPLWSAAALVIVVAGLREAQTVLLPIVSAITMAIICSPIVSSLQRRKVPRALAVVIVVGLLTMVALAFTAVVANSVSGMRDQLPHYSNRIREASTALQDMLQERGVRVQVRELIYSADPSQAVEKGVAFLGHSVDALASAVTQTFLVLLTMVLILLEGDTVPAKLRALSGDPDSDIAPFRRIAHEVQRYLAIKSVLSLATGLLIALWTAILGVDFPLLWGLLAFLLNYVPNIGSIIAAVPAMLIAAVQLGWGAALGVGAGFLVVNMVVGNFVEPWWMGRELGLSTTVVFLSLVVWGWIWGPTGMLLSVPLTMVAKIMLETNRRTSGLAALLDAGAKPSEPGPGMDLLSLRPPPPLDLSPAHRRDSSADEPPEMD